MFRFALAPGQRHSFGRVLSLTLDIISALRQDPVGPLFPTNKKGQASWRVFKCLIMPRALYPINYLFHLFNKNTSIVRLKMGSLTEFDIDVLCLSII